MNLHSLITAFVGVLLFAFSRTAFSMSIAAIVLFPIALWAVKSDLSHERGLDKIVALSNLCFALPLAVFGAEHFSAAAGIMQGAQVHALAVVLGVFCGLRVGGRVFEHCHENSGALVRTVIRRMMFLFVAMMDMPGTLAEPQNRINWVLLFREMSFGAGGWILAGSAMAGKDGLASKLIMIGRMMIGIAAIFYGVEHFLHPAECPGVPLEKLMPAWIPGPRLIAYLTGAILLVAGVCILLAQEDADGGNLSRHLDCSAGGIRLRADPDCVAFEPEHGR